MISLSVEDYCQNCPDFDPDCIVMEVGYYGKIKTVVQCKHKDKCRCMYSHIFKNMERLKNEQS